MRDSSPYGAPAPEIAPEIGIAPASSVDLDKVVFELKAAANAASSARKTEPGDGDGETDAVELPLEDAELGVVPQTGFLERGSARAGKRISAATLVSLQPLTYLFKAMLAILVPQRLALTTLAVVASNARSLKTRSLKHRCAPSVPWTTRHWISARC